MTEGHEPQMARAGKLRLLLQRADDARRMDMDRIDEHARATNTWGSNEHRHARDSRERDFEATLKSFDKLSDDQLDRAIEPSSPAG